MRCGNFPIALEPPPAPSLPASRICKWGGAAATRQAVPPHNTAQACTCQPGAHPGDEGAPPASPAPAPRLPQPPRSRSRAAAAPCSAPAGRRPPPRALLSAGCLAAARSLHAPPPPACRVPQRQHQSLFQPRASPVLLHQPHCTQSAMQWAYTPAAHHLRHTVGPCTALC